MGRAGQVDVQIRARSSEEKLSRQPSAGRPAEGFLCVETLLIC
jgi:hypothetical protein